MNIQYATIFGSNALKIKGKSGYRGFGLSVMAQGMSSASLPPELAAFLRDELGSASDGDAIPAFPATGPVWIWTGNGKNGEPAKGSWYFLTVSGDEALAIRAASAGRSGGWGSVKVEATIGNTVWSTSLFPSQSAGGFLLPLKATVRKAEKIAEGDIVQAVLRLV